MLQVLKNKLISIIFSFIEALRSDFINFKIKKNRFTQILVQELAILKLRATSLIALG